MGFELTVSERTFSRVYTFLFFLFFFFSSLYLHLPFLSVPEAPLDSFSSILALSYQSLYCKLVFFLYLVILFCLFLLAFAFSGWTGKAVVGYFHLLVNISALAKEQAGEF